MLVRLLVELDENVLASYSAYDEFRKKVQLFLEATLADAHFSNLLPRKFNLDSPKRSC